METLFLGLVFDIYSGISSVVSLLFVIFSDLSSVKIEQIISTDSVSNLTSNIYLLISIIMLFYATIAVLTYIVNPDGLKNGKNLGGKTILKNIIISLSLLVLLPFAFNLFQDLQTSIVKENIIGKVILGTSDAQGVENNTEYVGYTMIHTLTKTFLTPRTDVSQSAPEIAAYNGDPYITGNSNYMGTLKAYAQSPALFNWNWVLAIICSGFIALMILSFCFDIAIRLFKLLFYQLIAPIPVISYSLPMSKGRTIFDTWLKKYLTTYADLFIRLLIIFFTIFLISSFKPAQSSIGLDMTSVSDNLVIQTFVIMGLLLFAKEAPQLILDVFGIKSDGNFSLNPMSRIREVPLLGSAVQTAGAAVGGFATGLGMGYRSGGIGNAFKMGGLGLLSGGRAGFNQTKLGGVARKNQKIDKMAYNAGSSAVAQSITGNKDASSGFIDRFYNNIGTQLNKPTFEQHKQIEDAGKVYDKIAQEVATYEQQETELIQKRNVERSREITLRNQLNSINKDARIKIFDEYTSMRAQYASISQAYDAAIDRGDDAEAEKIYNDSAEFRTKFDSFGRTNSSIINDSTVQEAVLHRNELANRLEETVSVKETLESDLAKVTEKLGTHYDYEKSGDDYVFESNGERKKSQTANNHTLDSMRAVDEKSVGLRAQLDLAKDKVYHEKNDLKRMHGPYKKDS